MHVFITTLSLAAVVIGVTAILPQLVTMLRSRAPGGQSTLGWALGACANAALGIVNLLGSHALVLATGNLLSLTGCLVAFGLVRRYRTSPGTAEAGRATNSDPSGLTHLLAEDPAAALTDLPTGELAVLSRAMIAEHRGRLARRDGLAAC